jgi:hypothetical protein
MSAPTGGSHAERGVKRPAFIERGMLPSLVFRQPGRLGDAPECAVALAPRLCGPGFRRVCPCRGSHTESPRSAVLFGFHDRRTNETCCHARKSLLHKCLGCVLACRSARDFVHRHRAMGLGKRRPAHQNGAGRDRLPCGRSPSPQQMLQTTGRSRVSLPRVRAISARRALLHTSRDASATSPTPARSR